MKKNCKHSGSSIATTDVNKFLATKLQAYRMFVCRCEVCICEQYKHDRVAESAFFHISKIQVKYI